MNIEKAKKILDELTLLNDILIAFKESNRNLKKCRNTEFFDTAEKQILYLECDFDEVCAES